MGVAITCKNHGSVDCQKCTGDDAPKKVCLYCNNLVDDLASHFCFPPKNDGKVYKNNIPLKESKVCVENHLHNKNCIGLITKAINIEELMSQNLALREEIKDLKYRLERSKMLQASSDELAEARMYEIFKLREEVELLHKELDIIDGALT